MPAPLESIRVLDLTRLLPGPYCTMLLGDFGAEVIKIEDPHKGDYARQEKPKLDEDSALFHSLNRNKKSVCLNLKSKSGRESFLKLAEQADVIVESFRPGVMERLGLGYEKLKEKNHAIIYCAITGYGQTGPYRDKPGHDINYISYAGLLHLMGEKGGKPSVPAAQIADIGGGALPALAGILLALFEREKSGTGQFVDISMMDGVMAWLQPLFSEYFMNGKQPERGSQRLSGSMACYEVYQTSDQKWLSVGALELKFWTGFCHIIERPDFIGKLTAEQAEQEKMKQEIGKIIAKRTSEEWLALFDGTDTCVTPVLTFAEMEKNPHVKHRKMIQSITSDARNIQQIGIPIKLSKTPGEIYKRAPCHGEHTETVLKSYGISKPDDR